MLIGGPDEFNRSGEGGADNVRGTLAHFCWRMVAAAALWIAVPAQAQSALDASRVAPSRGLVSAVSAPRPEAPVTLRRVVENHAQREARPARTRLTPWRIATR